MMHRFLDKILLNKLDNFMSYDIGANDMISGN